MAFKRTINTRMQVTVDPVNREASLLQRSQPLIFSTH